MSQNMDIMSQMEKWSGIPDYIHSAEKTRAKILIDGLKKTESLTKINKNFRKQRWDLFEPRNSIEYIMKICFICNEYTDNKYDYLRFQQLLKLIGIKTKKRKGKLLWEWEDGFIVDDDQFSNQVTFGDLILFVQKHSSEFESGDPGRATVELNEALRDIDLKTLEDEQKIKDFIFQQRRYFRDISQAGRYYFIKGIVILIIHQICEFMETLQTISTLEPKKNDIAGTFIATLWESLSKSPAVTSLVDPLVSRRFTDGKKLLNELVKKDGNFCLYGKSSLPDRYFRLLPNNLFLTHLKDQTNLFAGTVKYSEVFWPKYRMIDQMDEFKTKRVEQYYNHIRYYLDELRITPDMSDDEYKDAELIKKKYITAINAFEELFPQLKDSSYSEKDISIPEENIQKISTEIPNILKHRKIVETLNSTQLIDFLGYHVNLNTLYRLLFVDIFQEKNLKKNMYAFGEENESNPLYEWIKYEYYCDYKLRKGNHSETNKKIYGGGFNISRRHLNDIDASVRKTISNEKIIIDVIEYGIQNSLTDEQIKRLIKSKNISLTKKEYEEFKRDIIKLSEDSDREKSRKSIEETIRIRKPKLAERKDNTEKTVLENKYSDLMLDCINGKRKIYRDFYLLYLLSLKISLFNFSKYENKFNDPQEIQFKQFFEGFEFPFIEMNRLSLGTVNGILKQIGYLDIDIHRTELLGIDIELIYHTLFRKSESELSEMALQIQNNLDLLKRNPFAANAVTPLAHSELYTSWLLTGTISD